MRKHIGRIWHFDIYPDHISSFFARHIHLLGWGIFGLVIILIFVSTFSTRASIARFYAQSCLGGWENPQGAQGIPEVVSTLSAQRAILATLGVLTYDREEYDRNLAEEELTRRKLKEFNRENSSVLDARSAEIFCGDFRGEIIADALPQKFVLKFSWDMKDSLDNEVQLSQSIDMILEEGINTFDNTIEPQADEIKEVEELPVEELPVEELPVEELPVEELPVEELPVEEIPI